MAFMDGYFSSSGDGWRLATSLMVLADELDAGYPDLLCGGTKGDANHALQGLRSDHNPFVTLDGAGIVRAMDISGPYEQVMQLRQHLYDLGAHGFAPLDQYGYLKGPDSQGNNWPIGTGWNDNSGDEGHLHISVTQPDGFNPVAGEAGYLSGIDSSESWGLTGAGLGRLALHNTEDPPEKKKDFDMPRVIRATTDFGDGSVVQKNQMFFDTGLTCHPVSKDDPTDATSRALALQVLWGEAVPMDGASVFRHIREAGNAQSMLAPGVLG